MTEIILSKILNNVSKGKSFREEKQRARVQDTRSLSAITVKEKLYRYWRRRR